MAFNHLLHQLLPSQDNDGIFIGELHTKPALRQSLTYLAPMIKANGVETVSLELPYEYVEGMLNAKSLEEWHNSPKGKEFQEAVQANYRGDEYYHLVQAFKKTGFTVLGHEDPDKDKPFMNAANKLTTKLIAEEQEKLNEEIVSEKDPEKRKALQESLLDRLRQRTLDKIQNDEKIKAELSKMYKDYGPQGDAGMRNRNAFAASYIKKHKAPGKVLALGGANHSERFGPERWPGSESTEKDGLDKALNLVSITINRSDNEGKVGATKKTIASIYGSRDSYEVILPVDLIEFFKKHNYTSWPPRDGVPVIGNLQLQKELPKTPSKPNINLNPDH